MSYSKYFCGKSPLKKEDGGDKKNNKESVTAYTMNEDTAIKAWSNMSDTEKQIYLKRNPNFTVPKLD